MARIQNGQNRVQFGGSVQLGVRLALRRDNRRQKSRAIRGERAIRGGAIRGEDCNRIYCIFFFMFNLGLWSIEVI